MSQPGGKDAGEGPKAKRSGALFAVVTAIILIAIAYLAFYFMDQYDKLEACLSSGQQDCARVMSNGK